MRPEIELHEIDSWSSSLKIYAITFLFLLTCGVSVGLYFLAYSATWTVNGTVEHIKGSNDFETGELEIKAKYPKTLSELLITTHNHLIGFSFIFLIIGGLFYFNTIVDGKLKIFFMTEPFISTFLTFSSIWGIRFVHEYFIYLTIISAGLTYFSYYFMTGILLYELVRGKIRYHT